jgi:hypothetical protein
VLISGYNLNSLADEVLGVTAVSIPRGLAGTTLAAGTSGTLYLRLIALPAGLTVNNLDFFMVGAATTPAHSWLCLLSTGGTVLAVTADGLAAGQAATTYYRTAVTAPFTVPSGIGVPGAQAYYVGLMLAATTMGTVLGGPAVPTAPTYSPVGIAPFPVCATGGTGLTTPPAVGAVQVVTAAAGTSANFYAATA